MVKLQENSDNGNEDGLTSMATFSVSGEALSSEPDGKSKETGKSRFKVKLTTFIDHSAPFFGPKMRPSCKVVFNTWSLRTLFF